MTQVFGQYIKEVRIALGYKTKDLAAITNIDQALISKFENGGRLPTDKQLVVLAQGLEIDYQELRKNYLTEKVYQLLKDEEMALEVMIAAEPRIEYLASHKVLDKVELDSTIQKSLDELDILKEKWSAVKGLKGIRKQKMDEYFSMKYTYQSNKIEGNTLTLSETTVVIKDGMTIAGKSVNDHLEAINHAEAIDLLYDLVSQKECFTKYNILQLHSLILRSINSRDAGVFRNVQVRISGAEHVPPQPYLVDKMMEDYFMYYRLHKHSLHPVILAAEMHERLVSIHPFIDGNGRTARLVMNLVLLTNGFPIAILKGDNTDRQKYYDALALVQMDDKPTAFYTLIIDALMDSIKEHIALAT